MDLSAFLPRLEDPSNLLPTETTFKQPINCTYRLATIQGKPTVLALPTAITHPYNYEKDKIPEQSDNAEQQQNVLPALQKEGQNVQFPELGQRCELEIVQPRSKSFGIELDDFLPVSLYISKLFGNKYIVYILAVFKNKIKL